MTAFSMSAWPIVLIFLGAVLLSAALTVLLSASVRRRQLAADESRSVSCELPPCKKLETSTNGSQTPEAKAAFSPAPSVPISPVEPSSSAVPEQLPTDSSASPVPEAEPVPEAAPAESTAPVEEAAFQDGSVIVEREDRF
jgi:hypothetical protein